MTDYTEWVSKLTAVGFSKVCVVNSSFQVVGASEQDAVPSAWNNAENVLVNENQELANDWSKLESSFCFFKKKFNVFKKDAAHVVGALGNDILVAQEFGEGNAVVRVIALGKKKGMLDKPKKGEKPAAFVSAPDAYNKACSALFDDLKEEYE